MEKELSENTKEKLNTIYNTIRIIKTERDILKKHLIQQIISYKLNLDDTITDHEIEKYYTLSAEQLIMLYQQLQFNFHNNQRKK